MFLLCSAEEDLAATATGELALALAYGSGEGTAASRTAEIAGLPPVAEPSTDPFTAF